MPLTMRFFYAVAALLALAEVTEGVKLVRSPGSFDPTKEDSALGRRPVQRRQRMGKTGKGSKGKGSDESEECVSKLICYSDTTTTLSAFAGDFNPTTFTTSDFNTLEANLDFGEICVAEDGSDVIVDITATTGSFFVNFQGGYDTAAAHFGAISLGVTLDGMTPVPAAVIDLDYRDLGGYEAGTEFDYEFDDVLQTHTAKFLFPNVAAGTYELDIVVLMTAAAFGLGDAGDAGSYADVATEVELGPHVIMAHVVDAVDFVCPAP